MLKSFAAAMLVLVAVAVPAWAGTAEDKVLLDAGFELNVPAVKAALARHANPNAYDGNNLAGTPLSITALGGLDEGLKLIQAGVDRNEIKKNLNGRAIEVTRILLAAGAKLGAHDKDI